MTIASYITSATLTNRFFFTPLLMRTWGLYWRNYQAYRTLTSRYALSEEGSFVKIDRMEFPTRLPDEVLVTPQQTSHHTKRRTARGR